MQLMSDADNLGDSIVDIKDGTAGRARSRWRLEWPLPSVRCLRQHQPLRPLRPLLNDDLCMPHMQPGVSWWTNTHTRTCVHRSIEAPNALRCNTWVGTQRCCWQMHKCDTCQKPPKGAAQQQPQQRCCVLVVAQCSCNGMLALCLQESALHCIALMRGGMLQYGGCTFVVLWRSFEPVAASLCCFCGSLLNCVFFFFCCASEWAQAHKGVWQIGHFIVLNSLEGKCEFDAWQQQKQQAQ